MWAGLPPSCCLKHSVKGRSRPMARILEHILSASSGSACSCCVNNFSRRVRPEGIGRVEERVEEWGEERVEQRVDQRVEARVEERVEQRV